MNSDEMRYYAVGIRQTQNAALFIKSKLFFNKLYFTYAIELKWDKLKNTVCSAKEYNDTAAQFYHSPYIWLQGRNPC